MQKRVVFLFNGDWYVYIDADFFSFYEQHCDKSSIRQRRFDCDSCIQLGTE